MNDGIGAILSTNLPVLSAAASQQSREVIAIYQDAAIHCQGDNLFWGSGGIELLLKLRVTIHQVAKMIQGIQQRRWVGIHTRRSDARKHYQGIKEAQHRTSRQQYQAL